MMKKWMGIAGVALLMSGCAGNPVTEFTNQMFNGFQDLPAEMRDRHIAGWVGFDEEWAGNYHRIARNQLYVQGVKPDTPEFGLRVIRFNTSNSEGSMLWMESGQLTFMTGAVVPDHMRRLRAGDIVEVRQTGTWKTMTDFTRTGEGNIVVRILCSVGTPEYKDCLEKAPRIGRFKGVGETRTPYPPNVKAYGYAFTPMYDGQGTALRSFP